MLLKSYLKYLDLKRNAKVLYLFSLMSFFDMKNLHTYNMFSAKAVNHLIC